jgi:hypothetical protein
MSTAIKEKPILFSSPMVRAILAGTKTQTRRIVKPPSGPHTIDEVVSTPDSLAAFIRSRCPYGEVGDRLWVRETLRGVIDTKIDPEETMPIAAYVADGAHIWTKDKFRVPWKWTNTSIPSIHMPRWASRLTLEITGIRVERLNDISREDAIAEGIEQWPAHYPGASVNWKLYGWLEKHKQCSPDPRLSYETLWESINGHGSWSCNPWVWVVEFKRVAQ